MSAWFAGLKRWFGDYLSWGVVLAAILLLASASVPWILGPVRSASSTNLPATDYLTLVVGLLGVSVFVVGFASVRMHADLDHAINRYETTADRMIETSRASSSFPRPSEAAELTDLFRSRWETSAEGVLSLLLSDLVLVVSLLLPLSATTGSPMWWTRTAVISFAALAALLGLYDYWLVGRQNRRSYKASIPACFRRLADSIDAVDFGTILGRDAQNDATSVQLDRLTLAAESLLSLLPSSPWAYASLAASAKASGDLCWAQFANEAISGDSDDATIDRLEKECRSEAEGHYARVGTSPTA